jgi:hypothetical protein
MMKEDGVPAGPLGYRALLDRGFSADHPPDDFRQALANIVQETIAFWCQQFVDAGIPAGEALPPRSRARARRDDERSHLDGLQQVIPARLDHLCGHRFSGRASNPSMTNWRSMGIPPGRAWRPTQAFPDYP